MTAPPRPKIDTFHRERSRLVDGFAKVEAILVRGITPAGQTGKSGTLATRIKAFRAQFPRLDSEAEKCLEDLAASNSVRTDIVHGVLSLVDESEKRYAVFSNARDAAKDVQAASRLDLASMKRLSEKLEQCTKALEKYIKP